MKLVHEKYVSPVTERRLVPHPDKPGRRRYETVTLEPGRTDRTVLFDFTSNRTLRLRLELSSGEVLTLHEDHHGRLRLMGYSGSLVVRPEASNVVTVDVEVRG